MTTAPITAAAAPNASSPTRTVPSALRGAVPAWAAVAAWGAGLIEIALGAGALTQGGAARGAGIALVALGAGALLWGAATLVRGRIVVPRTGVAASLAGIAVAVAALAADPVRTSVIAVAAVTLLLLAIALACVTHFRGRRKADAGSADAAAAQSAPPRVWVMIVAAILVAALVTPALAATEAGRSARPHGEHLLIDPGHH